MARNSLDGASSFRFNSIPQIRNVDAVPLPPREARGESSSVVVGSRRNHSAVDDRRSGRGNYISDILILIWF